MKSFEVARLFDLMADLLELKAESPFRIRAYRRAAQSLQSLAEDLDVLAAERRLDEIPSIGKDLAGKITEYMETGRMEALEALRRTVPAGLVELMRVPGIGPKTALLLHEKAGVDSITRLEELVRAGKLRGLPGIQAKTEKNSLEGTALLKKGDEWMPLGKALPLAQELVRALEAPRPERVTEAFASLPQVEMVLEKGGKKVSVRHQEGVQVDLRVVEPESFGAALQYFTGSKARNIRIRELAVKKGLKISGYGVFRESTGRRVAGATEEEVYAAVGLPWIPPEIREDSGEVEAALAGTLPTLVELEDIRGDLHCHTNASDGHHTVEALVRAAKARGYEYVLVSDHSKSTPVARGLSQKALLAHVHKVRALQKTHPDITILAGYVHILAYPTGRLMRERAPYEVDLDDLHARRARDLGVLVGIDTDTHVLGQLNDMQLGVGVARRAWIEKAQVVNSWPAKTLLAWARAQRTGSGRTVRARRRGRSTVEQERRT